MTKRLAFLILALPVQQAAFSHHSTAAFDTKTKIELSGTITRYRWANPHVFLWLETRDDQGKPIVWEVEAAPPAMLRRAGVTQDQIAVGDHVTVSGNPGRIAAKHQVLLNTLRKDDSKVALIFGQSAALGSLMIAKEVVTTPAASLEGTWGTVLNIAAASKLLNTKEWPLTEKGRQALAQAGPIDTTVDKCHANAAPGIMVAPDVKMIRFRGKTIELGREWDGVIRTVHMDQRSHDGVKPSLQGHAIGRWVGDTLVVDSAAFTPGSQDINAGVLTGPRKHLVEKFRLDADKTHVIYSFVLEDPDFLTAPVTGDNMLWTYRPDLKFKPDACDPDVAKRFKP